MNAVLARVGGMVVYYWLAGMLNKLSTYIGGLEQCYNFASMQMGSVVYNKRWKFQIIYCYYRVPSTILIVTLTE